VASLADVNGHGKYTDLPESLSVSGRGDTTHPHDGRKLVNVVSNLPGPAPDLAGPDIARCGWRLKTAESRTYRETHMETNPLPSPRDRDPRHT